VTAGIDSVMSDGPKERQTTSSAGMPTQDMTDPGARLACLCNDRYSGCRGKGLWSVLRNWAGNFLGD
jgi:hypothetical protein